MHHHIREKCICAVEAPQSCREACWLKWIGGGGTHVLFVDIRCTAFCSASCRINDDFMHIRTLLTSHRYNRNFGHHLDRATAAACTGESKLFDFW